MSSSRFQLVQAALDALERHGLQRGTHRRQHVDQLRAGIELGRPHPHLAIDAGHLGEDASETVQMPDLRSRPGRPRDELCRHVDYSGFAGDEALDFLEQFGRLERLELEAERLGWVGTDAETVTEHFPEAPVFRTEMRL